ncbi:MAG: nuclear transport factor 2 family protein [Actinomycetota bacterium]|nr:nuclear transport factor 2 family protein [Actinomycetota bacterium]
MTSRRFMMLVVSLALLLVVGCSATDATEDGALPDDMEKLLDIYEDAVIEGDEQAFVDLFTEDGVQVDPHGSWSAAVTLEAHVSDGFVYVDFESMERKSALVDTEGALSVEWLVTGMTGPEGTEKEPFSTPITAVFDVEEGLIAKSVTDWNTSELYYPSE